jgi:sulfotransferase family protein
VRERSTTESQPDVPGWERLDELEEYQHACRVRLEHVVPVREPLVLVSQVQRSGGTLLSRLFDAHPECHAHPYELHLGQTNRGWWPKLPLDRPDRWFATLFEQKAAEHLVQGYSKPGLKSPEVDVFPFVFLPRLQKLLFDECIAARPIERRRDVYDSYFTSYFNAWLDNQHLYSGPKKVVTAFTPRTILHERSIERFFDAYPDGTLVSLVRDPRAWYASASRHGPQYVDVGEALGLWRQSTEAAIELARRFGERVLVLTYEELVLETEATMERMAERLGISMAPILLVPTFNGREIRPNSSDLIANRGVLADRAHAYRDVLDRHAIARIDELAGELYERVRSGDAGTW